MEELWYKQQTCYQFNSYIYTLQTLHDLQWMREKYEDGIKSLYHFILPYNLAEESHLGFTHLFQVLLVILDTTMQKSIPLEIFYGIVQYDIPVRILSIPTEMLSICYPHLYIIFSTPIPSSMEIFSKTLNSFE